MANWTLNGDASTQPSAAVSPNRKLESVEMVRGISSSYLSLPGIIEVIPRNAYTSILYVKKETAQFACIRVGHSITSDYVEACYDLDTGTTSRSNVVGNVEMTEAFINSVGDGWFAIGITMTFTTSGPVSVFFTATDALESTVISGVSSQLIIHAWNPIFEKRANIETSYLGSTAVITAPEDDFAIVPIFIPTTTSLKYNTTSGQTITITLDPSENFDTRTSVTYYSIPQQTSHGFPDSFIVNDNKGGSETVRISRTSSFDRYSPLRIVFINKNGVLDTIWASRIRKYNQSSKGDMYYKNVIDYNDFSYDTSSHVSQRYNIVSKEGVTVNTALIPESENIRIKQLFHSEYVWLTDGNTTQPVNLRDSGIEYKTHNNEKLIQYSFKFEYANRLDNTIR